MSSCHSRLSRSLVAVALTFGLSTLLAQTTYPGVGRSATPREIAAWDIDVRPDFKGLPKGSGSVAQGQDVWEAKCASCHGIFGESNEVFTPLVGGTTKEDIKTGRVQRLNDPSFPGRTTLMKVSSVSTLWDYINRAMPWNAPKTLSTNEVFAVAAYLLNMGGIVPDNFVLSDTTIGEAQNLLPNRNGVTTDHALWPGKGMGMGKRTKPDVVATACMKDCTTKIDIASFLPDFARNNHGNLAEQQRQVGPQRGADTTSPPGASSVAAAAATASKRTVADDPGKGALVVAQKNGCTACHGIDTKIVGPGFREIAAKYASNKDAQAYLASKIKAGSQGIWGPIPMPAQSVSESELSTIAKWLVSGAKK